VIKITHNFGTGKPTNFKLGIRMEYDDRISNMRGDLQAKSSGWLFKSPLAGGGGVLWQPHALEAAPFVFTTL